MNENLPEISLLEWKDVSERVRQVNKKLAALVDNLEVTKAYPLVLLRQNFGELLVNNGKINCVPETFRKELAYSAIPLFMPLNKHLEVFVDNQTRVIPMNIIKEGQLVGLFETVDSVFNYHTRAPWSVCAGSRTTCLLPRISDQLKLHKLSSKYTYSSFRQSMTRLQDHWYLFKAIANSPAFHSNWSVDILFFSANWFDLKKNDNKAWHQFYHYIYSQAWQVAKFALFKIDVELQWERIITAISQRRLKPNPYIADTVKHLYLLSFGKFPGFVPLDRSEKLMPSTELQEVLVEAYGLKYQPTIVHCDNLENTTDTQPVYYSLAYPTLMGGSPSASTNKTRIMDLRDIMMCIETISKIDGESLLNNMIFDYFHVGMNGLNSMHPSSDITEFDSRFLEYNASYCDKDFAETSQFLKGCISIRRSIASPR